MAGNRGETEFDIQAHEHAIRPMLAHKGSEPYAKYRRVKELSYHEDVNEFLDANWTLLGVRVEDDCEPRHRNERFRYVVGWQFDGDPDSGGK